MTPLIFISNDQKAFIETLMDVPFNTFSREILIITQGETVVISTNPNYNFAYKNKNTNVSLPIVQTTINAIIEYAATLSDQLLAENPDIKDKAQNGIVRIGIPASAVDLIRGSKDIQFDGHSYDVYTDDIPRAMFSTISYFDFWLIRKK